jgi:alpha-amylase
MKEDRGVMIQYFHWYLAAGGGLWKTLAGKAEELAEAGFTAAWLPPAAKGAAGGNDTGYGVYDLYDLGEFDQKGSLPTKYGSKDKYLAALAALRRAGIASYADVVLNHRMGGDRREKVQATPYSRDNRSSPRGGQTEIEAYTRFAFPGRKGKHSAFEWHWRHFDAVDHDARHPGDTSMIYLLAGKTFDDYVSLEYGNYDYLMGCDLDFQNEEVRQELSAWGKWFLDTAGVDGFRLDAVKHIPSWFFTGWLDELRRHAGRDLFAVGEYWSPDLEPLLAYIDRTGGKMSLFDVPLHYNFHKAGRAGSSYDMRQIFLGSLVQERPVLAVTFVANHDSQALQALESVIEPWFKPLAYALILLRREGYPCVFFPDYYGAEYEDIGSDGKPHRIVMPSQKRLIDRLLRARRNFTYGRQQDYFDHPNTIGWTYQGDAEHPGALAVVLTNGSAGVKAMDTGKPNTRFVDLTGFIKEPVVTDAAGRGGFRCKGGSVSVWVEAARAG